MNIDIYETYEEANEALYLPMGDIPKLSKRDHPEQYSCVVFVRKWHWDKGKDADPPNLAFIGLECVASFHQEKASVFIYARIDGNDSQH